MRLHLQIKRISKQPRKASGVKDSKVQIILLTRSMGFPNGMAATQRVKLIAKGLIECGLDVMVLCTQVTERPPAIENQNSRGIYEGIPYEYTTGTTIRSNHFWIRRWRELYGITIAIHRLIQLKRSNKQSLIYYYGNIMANEWSRWIFYLAAKILQIPLITEVTERPWIFQSRRTWINSLSPLHGVQGAVVISGFLKNWAETEKSKYPNIKIIEVPILVNTNEPTVAAHPVDSLKVLFAGSPGYDETLEFIFASMSYVWKKFPNCKLMITGCRPGDPGGDKLIKNVRDRRLESRVELLGYLSREELLRQYRQASALLIPLFDDIRSKARFPTKLGEYFLSGRPVVTNQVGEVSRFFADQEDVYMCPPGNARLYAEKILDVLDNQEKSARIGAAGKLAAENLFDYRKHSKRLADFLESLI